MLSDNDAIATLAVKDINAAAAFYEGVLSFKPSTVRGSDQVRQYESGGSKLLVYQSSYAGTNQATAVTWAVDNLEALVASLKAKGVQFEHYDFPGAKLEGDIHVMGPMRNAWFKDPDGNILSLVNRPRG